MNFLVLVFLISLLLDNILKKLLKDECKICYNYLGTRLLPNLSESNWQKISGQWENFTSCVRGLFNVSSRRICKKGS